MSDGATETYRAGRAYNKFEKLIEEAIAEHILLIDEKKKMPKYDKLDFLIENTKMVEIRKSGRYKVDTQYGTMYNHSTYAKDRDLYPYVDYYELEISFVSGIYKTFSGPDFNEVLEEAIVYCAILQTPKGKQAVEEYSRY